MVSLVIHQMKSIIVPEVPDLFFLNVDIPLIFFYRGPAAKFRLLVVS